ncbi:MAG: phosphate acyltransferase PlsX, partial [Deltaproteobacteria bacterium]|nr:phosphate acyltransferase PlsX [Deltaproteobacteria bacterium]
MNGSVTLPRPLPVALDAMGGDYGAGVVVEGAVDASRKLGIPSILVGDEKEIRSHLIRLGAQSDKGVQVRHASQAISMDESPAKAIRLKPQASIGIAFELVRDGHACGVVSPGNTGAMMAAGLFISGTISGIARPAIASLVPRAGNLPPTILLDSGANIDCHAYQLVQFALMGSFYARSAIPCESPRVALLSNGTELAKGNDIIRSAAMILSEIDDLNFIGYVEGRDVVRNAADVVVCDGFIGNIVLKTIEGSAELVVDSIRGHVEKSWLGRFGMRLV